MYIVRPTAKWATLLLSVPGEGVLLRPAPSDRPLQVSAAAFNWLSHHGYVYAINTPEGHPIDTSRLEQWQLDLVDLFNTESCDNIVASIKGLTSKRVEELVKARPFNWQTLSGSLNDRQLEAAKKWVLSIDTNRSDETSEEL